MVINRHVVAFEIEISVKFGLLACDTRACDNLVLNSASVQRQSLNFVKSLSLGSNGSIKNALCQSDEVFTVSNEVGLALQGYHGRETIVSFNEYTAVRCLAVATFSSDSLTLLTDDLYCLVKVAFSVCEGFFAICKTGTGHLADFLYISY